MPTPSLTAVLLVIVTVLSACDSPDDDLIIGYTGALTGRGADLGRAGRDGALLAIEHQNFSNQQKAVLLTEDNRQEADLAIAAIESLKARGAKAIIGPMTSSMAVAVAPKARTLALPIVSPTTATSELLERDDGFFSIYPSTTQSGREMSSFIRTKLGLTSSAVVMDFNNRAYSENYFKSFREDFTASGGEVRAAFTYSESQKIAFLDVAQAIQRTGAESVLIIANALDAAVLVQKLKSSGYKGQIMLTEWSSTGNLIEYGGEAINGALILSTYNPNVDKPLHRNFLKSFTERFGYQPGFAAAQAYAATTIVIHALTGLTEPKDIENRLKSETYDTVSGSIQFDTLGDVIRGQYWMTVRNGEITGN